MTPELTTEQKIKAIKALTKLHKLTHTHAGAGLGKDVLDKLTTLIRAL